MYKRINIPLSSAMTTVASPAVLLTIASLLPARLTEKYSAPSTLVSGRMVIVVQAFVSPDSNDPIVMVKE